MNNNNTILKQMCFGYELATVISYPTIKCKWNDFVSSKHPQNNKDSFSLYVHINNTLLACV